MNRSGPCGPLLASFRRNRFARPVLRQVEAEQGEHPVLDALGPKPLGLRKCRRGVRAGPADLGDVGILNTTLHPALLALVQLMPEAQSCLADQGVDLSCGLLWLRQLNVRSL